MYIFVTGATGFIGSTFIKLLGKKLHNSDHVFVLTRKERHYDDQRFESIIGDLENIKKFKEKILQCEYVFHIAANATFGNDADYDKINFEPTKEIVKILQNSKKIRNFIFTSTIGAVDRHRRDYCKYPLDKNCIPSPKSNYGQSKLKSEKYIEKSGIPYTIIRPTWVYGSNMRQKSHINLFVTMVGNKSPIVRINFPGKVSLIHVDDLAKSLANCINNDICIRKTYFAETESKSIGEIFRIIWKKIYKSECKQFPMPSFRSIIGRIHSRLPLQINNLFIDYLYAIDDDFRNELLKTDNPKKIYENIGDVISTNAYVSGFWVITGANSGIGLALARKLKSKNKRLILIDKNVDVISKEFSKEKKGSTIHEDNNIILKADLSDFGQIKQVIAQIHNHPIYCLINNAGIGYRKQFKDVSIEEIDRIIAINVKAHLFMTKLLLEKLLKDESVIVNIASSIAYNPLPNMSLYSSTKAFLSNWSESLTYELRKTNKVITFSPSGTNTHFQEKSGVRKDDDGKGLLTPEYVADKILYAVKKNKSVVILGFKTKILLTASAFLPRKMNILFWGKLFEKMR
ncbi:MAG: SDR family NAD(P)-dependent oxidoreductase [Candidatus Woesearchaeota archaeon]